MKHFKIARFGKADQSPFFNGTYDVQGDTFDRAEVFNADGTVMSMLSSYLAVGCDSGNASQRQFVYDHLALDDPFKFYVARGDEETYFLLTRVQ